MPRCRHNRLRFVWRVIGQAKRYGFQCQDCGSGGLKNNDGTMDICWYGERRFYQEHDGEYVSPAAYDDNLSQKFYITGADFCAAERQESRAQWWDWYNTYLRSPAWRDKRQQVLVRDRNRCRREGCFSAATQVHHLTYQNVGYENLDELVSVCDACHEQEHRRS